MSRETDTPSSGPNGRGGAAYPSGTPPYGTPLAPDAGTDAARSGSQPEERKTETTLTTRIRINIPGSRPIPPVVVRTPVSPDAAGPAPEETGETPVPAPPAIEPPAEPAPPGGEKTSDWFAPRKSGAPKGGPASAAANGPGPGAGSATSGGAPAARPALPGRPSGPVAPGAARPGSTNGAGLPGVTGGPVAPGHGGGTGSFDVTEALAAGNGPRPGRPGADTPPNGSHADPYGVGDDTGSHALPAAPRPGGGPNASYDFTGPDTPGTPALPAGERRPPELPYFSDGDREQGGPGAGGFTGPVGPGGFGTQGPAGPTTGPAPGDGPLTSPHGAPRTAGSGPGGGLSDDTAILTPQKPAPEPGTPGYGVRPDHVSGHTVTSGIPVVPPSPNSPFAPGAATDGPLPHTPPKLPEPVTQNVPPSAPKAKKKGRSKLVLLGVLVVVLGGGVYGAGLLMNHTDVPKGTTVLGVDIGGGTRDDAVKKLDAAFGDRVNKPLKLTADGKTVTLTPDQAGLQFDTQQTVASAATSDYNPVSVIGSLFGQKREVTPVMPVDEEKLTAALQSAVGGSGAMTDGSIQFTSGKAVAVYGKAGKGIDAAKSAQVVEDGYRAQVETGAAEPIGVVTTTRRPTVTNAEVDREMKEFAKPAMSGNVTVRTDAAHSIVFSPQNSLWKFLKVKSVNGKLVDSPDLNALKELYGATFDGVLITRGTGKKTAVTPQDVYGALRQALLSTTARQAVIETDPS